MANGRSGELRVIDADGHYMEPRDLRPYVERKYRDRAPHLVVESDGSEHWEGSDWISQGVPHMGQVVFVREGPHNPDLLGVSDAPESQESRAKKSLYGELSAAALEPEARLQLMDSEGIDAAVLYPTAGLTWIPEADLHHAINRGLNDWLAEWCSPARHRLLGATNIVAIHDVDAACAEAIRCHEEHGFQAVFLRSCLPDSQVKWWDDTYDRFWRTCEEREIAIGLHPFPGDSMFGSASVFDIMGPEQLKLFMRTPYNSVVDSMQTLMGIIAGGVNERFPDLHFGILESSGGWVVPFLERLDTRFEYMSHAVPNLTMKPSDYFRRNWWIAFDPEEAMLVESARWLGADRIIWGSDYPHPDAFFPGFVKMLDENIAPLSPDEQIRIRGRNSADFYRLAPV
ncbi:MAG: amidohydrolase [Myxococcales bacterium]|nr:amidohydrolase [Myxococcales bacterium]